MSKRPYDALGCEEKAYKKRRLERPDAFIASFLVRLRTDRDEHYDSSEKRELLIKVHNHSCRVASCVLEEDWNEDELLISENERVIETNPAFLTTVSSWAHLQYRDLVAELKENGPLQRTLIVELHALDEENVEPYLDAGRVWPTKQ